MTSDCLIQLTEIDAIMKSRSRIQWHGHFRYMLEREPALRLFVTGQRAAMHQYLKEQGLTTEQSEAIDHHMMTMAAVSVCLLERAHRRLWEGMLPDLTTEMRPTT